uniref:Uncharacterized protein n=1 Tax=Arundo donax TaxID=35708 RepID=A0A0A9AI29_ARUDO
MIEILSQQYDWDQTPKGLK